MAIDTALFLGTLVVCAYFLHLHEVEASAAKKIRREERRLQLWPHPPKPGQLSL